MLNSTGQANIDQFEIVRTGVTSITLSAAGSGSVTINHNLGYPPAALIYLQDLAGTLFYAVPYASFDLTAGTLITSYYYSVTSSDLTIYISSKSSVTITGTTYFKYYLLKKTAN